MMLCVEEVSYILRTYVCVLHDQLGIVKTEILRVHDSYH